MAVHHAAPRLRWRSLAALLLAVVWSSLTVLPAAADEDFPVPGGYFFAHRGVGAGRGYIVVDDQDAPMLTCVRQLGGVAKLGRPISNRFTMTVLSDEEEEEVQVRHVIVRQAFVYAVVEWRASEPRCALASIPVPGADRDSAGEADLADEALAMARWDSPAPVGFIALDQGLVPAAAAVPRPPSPPDPAAIGAPRVVVGSAGLSGRFAAAALDGANRAAALLVPRYRLRGPPEVVIRLFVARAAFLTAALALPEVREEDRAALARQCAARGRDYRTGGFTLLLVAPCGDEADPVGALRRRAALWYASIVHQAAGPHWSFIPAWFAHGLAWHEAGEAVPDWPQPPADVVWSFPLEALTDVARWSTHSDEEWERASRQAIDAVGRLRTELGPIGPATILRWAKEVGFEQAFSEVTGMTVAQFEAQAMAGLGHLMGEP